MTLVALLLFLFASCVIGCFLVLWCGICVMMEANSHYIEPWFTSYYPYFNYFYEKCILWQSTHVLKDRRQYLIKTHHTEKLHNIKIVLFHGYNTTILTHGMQWYTEKWPSSFIAARHKDRRSSSQILDQPALKSRAIRVSDVTSIYFTLPYLHLYAMSVYVMLSVWLVL